MEVENQTLDPLRSNFKAINHHKPYKISREITFEFKVIYMRIISSSYIQSCMNLIFPQRDLHSILQINGLKINPSEKISRPLNKHRADALMSESVYVNTDRIKFNGFCLPFEVQIQGSFVLVSGILRRKRSGFSGAKDDYMWVMECKEGGIRDINGELVDVCFAGRSLGKPLLLNGVVELKKRKVLDWIPEGDEEVRDNSKKGEKGIEELEPKFNSPNEEDMTLEEEEELSWFTSGVRVGIGLGLGMSLGVGVGLGLIIRTYKATSEAFRRFKV